MKLWQQGENIDKIIERFTIGQDNVLDLELAKYDIIGSIAHAKMLNKIGLLKDDELNTLVHELELTAQIIENGEFKIEDGVEDIHSQIEFILTETLGEVGKKIHAGRSRNDQVLVDLKLYYRDHLSNISNQLKELAKSFIHMSESHKAKLMPGYTHMQVAMVSSFGLWFGCFAEALADDNRQLQSTMKIVNQNPLGSAAGYGNSFPLDRNMTTELLAFDNLCYNSMYAQFTRGKTELIIANTLSSISYTLNKFAMDVCLFSGQNHRFITLPDELTTGSSIMPHKKNPDVFELMRAKSAQLMSIPTQIMMICNNLMSGYHRDFQQLKEILFPALKQMSDLLTVANYCVIKIQPLENLLDDDKYKYLFSVDEVNALVKKGIPFREAYKRIKESIINDSFQASQDIDHTHIGSLGNLANDEILKKINEA